MTDIVQAVDLTRILPGPNPVTLVSDITLSFSEGSFSVITGPSGSGKSSLLYLLGLLDPPTRGDVLVAGESTAGMDADTRARLRLERFGFVFQFHFLLPEFTVLENVLLPMRQLRALSARAMRDRALSLLQSLDMEGSAGKLPATLSGGQRQRTAIARALANDPQFILADEPTGALDTKNGSAVFAIMRALAQEGRTIIAVTHDEGLAATADRRIRLVDGKLDSITVRSGG